jgi:hypothetical protein
VQTRRFSELAEKGSAWLFRTCGSNCEAIAEGSIADASREARRLN